MKHGKNPTRKQKKTLKENGLNYENWFVCMETPKEMVIEHRHTGTVRKIIK